MSSKIERIAEAMRADWNRRIAQDPYVWMSDAADLATLWSSGERDLQLLCGDDSSTHTKALLEIGCGVGRLLRPALNRYAEVIGVDISNTAIEKARELLGPQSRLSLITNNGFDLEQIPSHSINTVVSFAAMICMTPKIVARYLAEIKRVLAIGGRGYLQLYVGKEQAAVENDTLHLRCYREDRLREALNGAGLSMIDIRDLILPFEASAPSLECFAKIIVIGHGESQVNDVDSIAAMLMPTEESYGTVSQDLESWMSLSHAERLSSSGHDERAKAALVYAEQFTKTTTLDIKDILDRIERKTSSGQSPMNRESNNVLEQNLIVLEERFPGVLATKPTVLSPLIEVKHTAEGPVMIYDGQPLDHPEKPKAGAEAWIKRSLSTQTNPEVDRTVIFGFGGGYHIEELLNHSKLKLSVVEPAPDVFWMALAKRDLTNVLRRIDQLVVGAQYEKMDVSHAEYMVRPQSQALFPELCAAIKQDIFARRGLENFHPSIVVLGPLQGGTLPICGYTNRALLENQQRTRALDMSGFNQTFSLVPTFTKEKLRTVSLQNQYLEFLSQIVLEHSSEKPFDVLICMAQAPISFRALEELRKRGVITVLWFVEDYLRFSYWQEAAKYFDFIFTIQKGECISAMKAAGAQEVYYLPTAADPGIHRPMQLSMEERQRWGSPISFVGAGYHNRQQMFASLSHMPMKIWGTEWPGCRPFDKMVQEEGRRLTPDEYVRIFNGTDINLNLHSSIERDGVDPFGDFVNPRVFELAASGAFQLCDERSLLGELFKPNEEIVTFSSPAELKDKISYYLERPQERQIIAERARKRVLEQHTYGHRIREMLNIIYRSKYERLERLERTRPWSRLLKRAEIDPELKQRCEIAFRRGEEPILDGLVADITMGAGKLTPTEQKLMFLFHVRKQMVVMKAEERGDA